MPTLANLPGLWALLGIPAILAIHFLQRRSRLVTVTTRFLLDHLAPVSTTGRRFERLRNSATLWLQLLAVLLVTWLLVQPHWLRPDSRQTLVVVLDSSVSMDAFLPELDATLANALTPLARTATRTDWIAIESDPAAPRLYAGPSLDDLRASLTNWQPNLGTHDITPALRLARTLARDQGTILFVSDQPTPIPDGVQRLGIGSPIPNVGWIGLRTDEKTWTALVQNHGQTPVDTTWQIDDREPTPLRLEPGQTRALTAEFPPNVDRLTLTLPADPFTIDDTLPIVRPLPKELTLTYPTDAKLTDFFTRVTATLANARLTPTDPDLRLTEYEPLAPTEIPPSAITFLTDPSKAKNYVQGTVIAAADPLVSDLNWQGLLVRDTFTVPPKENDQPLLWQGDRPLIFLRGTGPDRTLVLNFDLRQSNADRLPALILLLTRFANSIRDEKQTFTRQNFELNQPLDKQSRAPSRPRFFEIQNPNPVLAGATHFADPREADFTKATATNTLKTTTATLTEKNTEQDYLTPLWLLLLATTTLASWATTKAR